MYDILIKNGRVYDGTGAPWFYGNVAIKDGKIAAMSTLEDAKATRVIDAVGMAVSPGFIDIHSHSDSSFLVSPKADSKVKQGVTLEVAGNCGSSIAPLTEKTRSRAASAFLEVDMEPTWTTMGEYFEALEKRGMSANLACLVGHGTIRAGIMGFDRRPPTDDEMQQMKALLAQAMDEGAVGMSSGLIYPPSSYADTEELIELSKVLNEKKGLYFTHMRNEGVKLLDSVAETIRVGREANVPVQIAHHKASGRGSWGLVQKSLPMLEEARKQGIDVTADQYPYIASSTGLTSIIPGWAHEGGRQAMLERLTNPETRARLKEEVTRSMAGDWERLVVSKVSTPGNKRFEGMHLAAIAEARSAEPCDAAFDLLIEEKCDVGQIRFGMCEEDVKLVMRHPLVMVGSDGSSLCTTGPLSKGKPHPRNYGTFARVLGKYVREESVLPLEEALRKMTSFPAWRLGLWDRGVLRPGAWADVTVFDPDTVKDASEFIDPHKYAVGIPYVVVNGKVVVDAAEHTGETPGMVLRRGR